MFKTKPIKPVPACPQCGHDMVVVGNQNRGELKTRRLFGCMNRDCTNKRLYTRNGEVT